MKSSGILLGISALPTLSGLGTLSDVDRFIEFLVAAKQKYWQIAPVTPADGSGSVYLPTSAFAGNTLVVGADQLAASGLLSESTLLATKTARGYDYDYAATNKEKILREAYANFLKLDPPIDFADFCDANETWLNDYALFCALSRHFDGKPWWQWDDGARRRSPSALATYRDTLSDEIDYYVFCQYIFDRQWQDFRAKLAANDIKLIGEIPICLSYNSADVWANQTLFDGADGKARYNFGAMKRDGYKWWRRRLDRCAKLFDLLRVGDCSAFESYVVASFEPKACAKMHFYGKKECRALKRIFDEFALCEIVSSDNSAQFNGVSQLAASPAELVIYSMQDLVTEIAAETEQTTFARYDRCFMANRGDMSQANAKWLAKLTDTSGRSAVV